MEEKERFKLTEELKNIFKKSAEFVKKKDYKDVSSEVVIYYLLEKYIKDKNGMDEVLNVYLSDYTDGEKDVLLGDLEEVRDCILNDFKNPLPDKYKNKPAPVNPNTDDILKRAWMEAIFFNTNGSENGENNCEISSTLFLLSQLFESDVVTEVLNNFDITKENLTRLIISMGKNNIDDRDGLNVDPVTQLKEKILNNSEATSAMNESNDDEENRERMRQDDEEFDNAGKVFENAGGLADPSVVKDPNSEHPYLDKYGTDMTKNAAEGKYDKVLGREKELKQLIEILCCRKKNNALILSQNPGIGKSALVELLAQKIVANDVPDEIKGKQIYSLNLNSMVSGAIYRGSCEKNWENVIKEVINSNHKIIIFIDEFQCLLSNGSSSGSGSGSDILKPYLARGEFQTIGALLIEDYRKFVEPEGALKRRFQNVVIDEPTSEETFDILKGIQDKYSKYHRVKYTDEVISACVNLSNRYIIDRYSPDRDIDCLDLAGSIAKLRSGSNVEKNEELESKEKELKKIIDNKIKSVKDQDFEKAAEYKKEEGELKKKVEKLKKAEEKKLNNPKNWPTVTIDDVVNVVAKISNVPIDIITQSDSEKIRYMKSKMEENVIGQQEAIDKLTLALQRNILGLRDENKPIASIYLSGVTSSGKTLSIKMLAKYFFGSEKNLIRFDMGEFTQDHEVTKLISTSAGFIGYNDRPLLDEVRRKPYSVVLFDEIEKAAKSINNIFLNILSEGYITLGNGTKVDFKNTIIVFTSNVGTSEILMRGDGLGFSKMSQEDKNKDSKAIVLKAMKKHFKPEFISRLTDIIVFNNLTKEDFEKIFDLELNKVSERLNKRGLKLTVSKAIKDLVISESKNGRDLEKGIIKYVENEICNSMVNDSVDVDTISGVSVDYKDGKVVINYKSKLKKLPKLKKTIEIKADEEKTESVVE